MPTQAEIYGYGTIANIICCVCSLGGAIIFPCAEKHANAYHLILSIFMGLAVGTLGTDAIVHLIPEAFSLHDHSPENNLNKTLHGDNDEQDEEKYHVEPYVWYSLIIMLGIYSFYLLEMVMSFFQSGLKKDEVDSPVVLKSVNLTSNDGFTKIPDSFSSQTMSTKSRGDCEQEQRQCCQSISSLAIMIIVGDAVHNFADGLAVAAAFSSSVLEGVAITIAIFCHELPHELGDFAVLIGSGMSFGKALLANLISSLTALAGFYIGVPISVDEKARLWIFAITAGMFLYISLVDMLPTLVKKARGSIKTFIYHNIGILLGALIITSLGVFESHVSI